VRLSDINGGTIAEADFRRDKAFENFVRELLDHERRKRHAQSARLHGPLPRYEGDGQRDLVLLVVDDPSLPRSQYRDALTWDDIGELGETWYSCKGGDNWKDEIKRELGNAAYRRGSVGELKGKRPSADLLEHLAAGRRYVFVLSRQTDGGRSFLDELAKLLAFWLQQTGLNVPPQLRDQLSLIDANHLADFIKSHAPTLSTDVVRALGATEPAALMSFDDWARRITPNRQPPTFEHDPERDAIIGSLRNDTPRIKRVYGPPGIGKTRTVLEALSQSDDVRGRVRYTDRPALLFDELRAWLPGAKGVILVVDEIRSHEAGRFVEEFLSDPATDARMILSGTTDYDNEHDYGGTVECLHLSRLSEHARRELIRHEFEQADADPGEHLDTIARLSEGYPLLAVKLAEALARDGQALAGGNDETTRWDAVQRVLVGPRSGRSDEDYAHTVETRGRCLLVVLLTRFDAMDWEQLWERRGQALANAIDWNADELRRAKADCMLRELLREPSPHHRYVSPANLARMLLNHYLSGPPGPDLGPRIVRHTPEFRESLLALAREVEVRSDVLRRLAESYWMELQRLLDVRDLERLKRELYGHRAREEAPREAAEVAARIVREVADSLDARTRRELAETLVHTTRRQLDFETFALAERALALLAQGDAYACKAWKALFFAALSPTHQPWERRLELLVRHARASDPRERRLVANALESLLADERAGPPFLEPDTRDGDWSTATATDYHAAKSSLWLLALELADDPDSAVCNAARAAIAACFTAPTLPIEAIEALVVRVSTWDPQQRSPLLEAVEWIRQRHGDRIQPRATAALAALVSALEPKDLEARIINHVMNQRWRRPSEMEAEIAEHTAQSRNLATELLQAPVDVRERLLAWLGSSEAKWAHFFMRELGCVDSSRVVLGMLEAHARTDPEDRLLPAYVRGWAQVDTAVDAWLAANVHGDLAQSVIWALPELLVTPPRFALLEALIAQSRLDVEHMRRFADRHSWTMCMDAARVLDMLELLRDRGLAPTSGLTMTRVLLTRPLTESQRARALELLGDFLGDASTGRIPMIAQLDCQQAAIELARAGQGPRLTELILRLLERDRGNLRLAEEILQELLGAGYGPILWPGLRGAMLEPSHGGIEIHLARVGMLDHVDIPELLDWIDADEARARKIAKLTNPYTETLSPIITELLKRFGSRSRVAIELHDRARENPMVAMGSLEFERRQLAHAQAWSRTADSSATQEWAQSLIQELGELIERQELRSALERKYA
jgi:hypothetical protein